MNSIDFEAFDKIVKYGSYSKAANEMAITQPALSHRISLLEEELGYQLFVRGKGMRSIQLTEQGEMFLKIAAQMDQLTKQAIDLRNINKRRPFTISGTQSINYILDEAYCSFAAENPDIYLTVNTLNSVDAYHQILNDELDFAFINTPDSSRKISAVPFMKEDCTFICAKGTKYPKAVTPAQDLSPENLIWCRFDESNDSWYDKWFRAKGFPLMSIRNPITYPTFLEESKGWGICPASIAEKMKREGLIETRTFVDGPQSRNGYYIVGPRTSKDYTARFIAHIENYIRENYPMIHLNTAPELKSLVSA